MNIENRTFSAIGQYGFPEHIKRFPQYPVAESSFLKSECRKKCELARDQAGNLINTTPDQIDACTASCKLDEKGQYCTDFCIGAGLTTGTPEWNQCMSNCRVQRADQQSQLWGSAIGSLGDILGQFNLFGQPQTEPTPYPQPTPKRGGSPLLFVGLAVVVIIIIAVLLMRKK